MPNLLPAIISGTGGFTVSAPSTMTLTGANTYTGPTNVTGGATLFIGNGGSIASSSSLTLGGGATFDIGSQGGGNQTVNNLSGTSANVALGPFNLTVNETVSTVFDGVISGLTPINGLIKTGSATLTLTRGSTYIGPTTIQGGTIALGAFGSLQSSSGINLAGASATFDITNFAPSIGGVTIQDLAGVAGTTVALGATQFQFGTADSTDFAGAFTGTGQMTKQGTGTLVLDGNSSGFTGSTLVAGGALEVGDAATPGAVLGGNVTVGASGLLEGHGKILGSVTNNSGGTVLPGGSIGTLTVGGNYTQGSTSTLLIQVSPTASSQLAVGGAASLAGTLNIQAAPGNLGYVPFSKYVILTAGGGITGTFNTITGTLPLLLPVEPSRYLPNAVDVTLGGFSGVTGNQTGVANVLNAAFPTATGDFATVLGLAVNLPAGQMQRALSSFAGQIYGNLARGDPAVIAQRTVPRRDGRADRCVQQRLAGGGGARQPRRRHPGQLGPRRQCGAARRARQCDRRLIGPAGRRRQNSWSRPAP